MDFKTFLANAGVVSQAAYPEYGYGQVEPNHLSAQRNGGIYAQLPAKADINILEQGQFVKYNYAAGVVDFEGPGEWMLVYNEIKLPRDGQQDCEFALKKDDYQARIYSPVSYDKDDYLSGGQSRYYNGEDAYGATKYSFGPYTEVEGTYANNKVTYNANEYDVKDVDGDKIIIYNGVLAKVVIDNTTATISIPDTANGAKVYAYDKVTGPDDPYEIHYNGNPYQFNDRHYDRGQRMPEGATMVPRVFKTNVGDIYTTNLIDEATLEVGDILTPDASNGILRKYVAPGQGEGTTDKATDMQWQVARVYTMPDHQRGVKLIRIV